MRAKIAVIDIREWVVSLLQLTQKLDRLRFLGPAELDDLRKLMESSQMVLEPLDGVFARLSCGHQERPITAFQQEQLTSSLIQAFSFRANRASR